MKRISAESLIELAAETLRSEIAPTLPAEKRYLAAMIGNALEIARREIITDGETAAWTLLDTLYPDGDGTAARLAADIRHGKFSDRTHADLRKNLRAILVSELKIRNPKFLSTRGIAA